MRRYKAVDLFCGAGGLTLGLKQAGFEVIAGVEIKDIAVDTYSLNHKNHKIYDADIRTLSPKRMMADLGIEKGELDLLAGCPPCQGFSTHRTRNKSTSMPDDRNGLVFEFVRYVRAFLPKTIMMENVPGLAKDKSMEKVTWSSIFVHPVKQLFSFH
jgi:DNA (cytosine-5)-methyltransferase 1